MTLADFAANNAALGLAPAPANQNTNFYNPSSAGFMMLPGQGGQTLGTTTSAPAAKTTVAAPSGGTPAAPSGGGGTSAPSGPSQEDIVKGQINGAYDAYISSLDDQLNTLSGQKDAMGTQIKAGVDQTQNGLDLQLGQGNTALQGEQTKLDQNQKKTLQGLTEDVTNQFQAGNVYLGARGAGDSSAANQYAYAISKQGNKQRAGVLAQTADITNQINVRKENLKQLYDTETNNNKLEYDKQMGQLAQWFADSQSQIQGLKGTANLNRGTSLAQMSMDLLTQAKQRAQDIQTAAMNKQSALEAWALNNSKTLEQARAKLGDQSAFTAPSLTRGAIVGANAGTAGSNSGTAPVAYGYGSTGNTQDKNLATLFA